MSEAFVAAAIVRARRRIEHAFEEASATAPERAIPYEPSGRMIARRVFRRLVAHGAVVETRPGSYYLDRDRMAAYRASLRMRAAGLIALAAMAVGVAVALNG